MRVIDLVGGGDIIPTAECLDLLRSSHIGRVGVVVDDQVEIFPVNYSFDGERVTVASNQGHKLRGILGGGTTFEVDSFDESARTGWSVVVHGSLETIEHDGDESDIQPWSGPKHFLVRLRPEAVSGRRIRAESWLPRT